MVSTPVLKNVYTRIDMIDYNERKFTKYASIFLLGDAASTVKESKDVSTKNKKLVESIGLKATKELTSVDEIVGGDDWDELDDLDVEDLLNTETVNISKASTDITNSKIKGDIISDIVLYSKDKSVEVKEKVALLTGIYPYKQYIWNHTANKSIDNSEINLFKHYELSANVLEGYPIDGHIQSNIEDNSSIGSSAINDVVILYCITIDSLIQSKSKLLLLLNSDVESFDIIYMNAFGPFFPLLDNASFTQYLMNDAEIKVKFPELAFDKKDVQIKLNNRKGLLTMINKENPVSVETSDFVSASTMNMVLSFIKPEKNIFIDTSSLFKLIDITAIYQIVAVDIYSIDNERRNTRLRKIQQFDQYREGLTLSNTTYPLPKRELIYNKCAVFYFMANDQYSELILIVNQYGSVWIKAIPNKLITVSKKEFIDIITPIINKTIELINMQESAFMTMRKFCMLPSIYQIASSSTRISFKFSIDYTKLLNLLINTLYESGFIDFDRDSANYKNRTELSLMLQYGISSSNTTKVSEIKIKNMNGLAIIELINLDVEESNLYMDIIGRLIINSKKTIQLESSNKQELALIDPILFTTGRPDNYRRICQKPFQPVITTKDDKKSIEYYNFTFNKPEYYKCPNAHSPELGFISGKHELGYCLPCCRKMKQPDVEIIKSKCIANEDIDKTKFSSYKIDYPINSITNQKIANRRIQMPKHIIDIFSGLQLVANGSIVYTHKGESEVKSFAQTASLLTSIESQPGVPLYGSLRELIMTMIEFIKNPLSHIMIMKHPVVIREFTTPQELIHKIEDSFIKHIVVKRDDIIISDMEWNDIIIYIANCMKMNILVLFDDRMSNIKITNMHNIDIDRPVVILLKRLDIEWSMLNQNIRALYLPITLSSYRVLSSSEFVIPRIDCSIALHKINNIYFKTREIIYTKQFTLNNINEFIQSSKQYKVKDKIQGQKIVVIGVGKKHIVSTFSSAKPVVELKALDVSPTASFNDILTFIQDYNSSFVNEIPASEINNYKEYVKTAIKATDNYKFINMRKFLLKICKIIQVGDEAIGVIVNVINVHKISSTELMFMKPVNIKTAIKDFNIICDKREAIHVAINTKQILSFPVDQCANTLNGVVKWATNPLEIKVNQKCKNDMTEKFNNGAYMNGIYQLAAVELVNHWKTIYPDDLKQKITDFVRSQKNLPLSQIKIDELLESIETSISTYDIRIIRIPIMTLFGEINTYDKDIKSALKRIEETQLLNGVELSNLHKWTKEQIGKKIIILFKSITVKSNVIPLFVSHDSLIDQRSTMYKADKLIIYEPIYNDLVKFLAADLSNPFRRDYIINMQFTMSALEDIRPHIGELIYVKQV